MPYENENEIEDRIYAESLEAMYSIYQPYLPSSPKLNFSPGSVKLTPYSEDYKDLCCTASSKVVIDHIVRRLKDSPLGINYESSPSKDQVHIYIFWRCTVRTFLLIHDIDSFLSGFNTSDTDELVELLLTKIIDSAYEDLLLSI